ncbi:hypothetical protein HAX54_031398 [Datura stramonium]|uniref:Uncharacterized protein n=1 Tax=Datura stramonium TaxID=4076 RepID=A0ABS8VAF7_DATST|nr:hypothetical protein [Datura stramonium]
MVHPESRGKESDRFQVEAKMTTKKTGHGTGPWAILSFDGPSCQLWKKFCSGDKLREENYDQVDGSWKVSWIVLLSVLVETHSIEAIDEILHLSMDYGYKGRSVECDTTKFPCFA